MRLRFVPIVLFLTTAGLALRADEPEKKLVSGPPAGENLPGPFDSRIINGEFKEKQHCLICENRLFPVILVFVRDPEPPKEWKDDGPIRYLFDKLEEAVDNHERFYLKANVIWLSPDAHSSATDVGVKEAKVLVEEAKNRDLLLKKLTARAEKSKNVIMAAFPKEGPKGWKIDPAAAVTIVFFNQLRVIRNEAFGEGKMTKEDVDRFIGFVDSTIKSWRVPEKKASKPA
ncbi:MAG: hypothetical protein U0793_08875 [Gemmataceae bacterium]